MLFQCGRNCAVLNRLISYDRDYSWLVAGLPSMIKGMFGGVVGVGGWGLGCVCFVVSGIVKKSCHTTTRHDDTTAAEG